MEGNIRLFYSEIIKNQATINIGTAGTVSNGKSTTVRAVTGIRTQRHKKEIEKNLTINLGYANVKIFQDMKTGYLAVAKSDVNEMRHPVTGDEMKLVRHISYVDTPGHNSYVATMISGTALMDAALLIIAANEQKVPTQQCYEHLLALNRANIYNILILQNKMDIVSKKEAIDNLNKIREFIAGSPIENSVILPISAQFNTNIDQVVKYLRHGVGEPIRKLNEPVRITIVRSFDVNKPNVDYTKIIGGVIGGSLTQGVLFIGDWIEIRPGVKMPDGKCHPLLAKVVSLYSEKNKMEYAIPGGLIAIGLDIDPGLTRNNVLVGSVAGRPGTLPPIYQKMLIKYGKLRRNIKLDKIKVDDKITLSANSAVINTIVEKIDKKHILLKTDKIICGDIGMNVALLRNDNKTGSIGLDFHGKIESVEEINDIYYPTIYKDILESIPDRKIEVVLDIPSTEKVVFKYTECMDNIKFKNDDDKVRFILPNIDYNKPYSTFSNFQQCYKSMDFHNKMKDSVDKKFFDIKVHFSNFITTELVTSCTLNGKMEMIIKGKYDQKNMIQVITRYIDRFLKCKNCHKIGCALYKKDKMNFQYCNVCHSQHSLLI